MLGHGATKKDIELFLSLNLKQKTTRTKIIQTTNSKRISYKSRCYIVAIQMVTMNILTGFPRSVPQKLILCLGTFAT